VNRREAERLTHQADTLRALGFTVGEAESLRRISMTLRRWHELECGDGNGVIERDEKTGVPYWFNANARYVDPRDPRARRPIPDRETGAKKRLSRILLDRLNRTKDAEGTIQGPALTTYIQGDPRGAALYILRPGDVPEGKSADAYYSRGICIY
jgi:hypothetical protein